VDAVRAGLPPTCDLVNHLEDSLRRPMYRRRTMRVPLVFFWRSDEPTQQADDMMMEAEDYPYCLDCWRSPDPDPEHDVPSESNGREYRRRVGGTGERDMERRHKNGFECLILYRDAGDHWEELRPLAMTRPSTADCHNIWRCRR